MVPHVQVEDTLNGLIKDQVEDDETYKLVVTAVPDPKKGERLGKMIDRMGFDTVKAALT